MQHCQILSQQSTTSLIKQIQDTFWFEAESNSQFLTLKVEYICCYAWLGQKRKITAACPRGRKVNLEKLLWPIFQCKLPIHNVKLIQFSMVKTCYLDVIAHWQTHQAHNTFKCLFVFDWHTDNILRSDDFVNYATKNLPAV